jgi:hypothetical protein
MTELTGEIQRPPEEQQPFPPHLVKLADTVLFLAVAKEDREKIKKGEKVEEKSKDEVTAMRDTFIAKAREEFPKWKDFNTDHNLSSEEIRKRKISIGLQMMDNLEWRRDLKGRRREKRDDLERLMRMLNGKTKLSVEALREFKIYSDIIQARLYATGFDAINAGLPSETSAKEQLAYDFIDGIGRLAGNPLVRAILEQDLRNRGLPVPPKK